MSRFLVEVAGVLDDLGNHGTLDPSFCAYSHGTWTPRLPTESIAIVRSLRMRCKGRSRDSIVLATFMQDEFLYVVGRDKANCTAYRVLWSFFTLLSSI